MKYTSFKEFLNEQKHTSQNTDRHQIPATYKPSSELNFDDYDILDYGCGSGLGKEYVQNRFKNAKVYNYEPNNKNFVDERQEFIDSKNPRKMICCNNVLNIIDDDLSDILKKIKLIAMQSSPDTIIFKIHEGDGSGIGRETDDDNWQRNEKRNVYLPKIENYFNDMYNVKKYKSLYIILKIR